MGNVDATNTSGEMGPIPRDVALRLCREIREENRGKWYRWTAWWCWGCETFCKGDPDKMCVSNQPDYRGCLQVNERYARDAQRSQEGDQAL